MIKVKEVNYEMENECKQRENNMRFDLLFVLVGIFLFLFGTQLATYTNTNLNYSAFGAFIFLAGLLIYVANRPKKRRR